VEPAFADVQNAEPIGNMDPELLEAAIIDPFDMLRAGSRRRRAVTRR